MGWAGIGAGWGQGRIGSGAEDGWGLDIGLELGWDFSHTFNENSELMKMQFKAKFIQFLFILLLRV